MATDQILRLRVNARTTPPHQQKAQKGRKRKKQKRNKLEKKGELCAKAKEVREKINTHRQTQQQRKRK